MCDHILRFSILERSTGNDRQDTGENNAITASVANYDNNQHAANENIRLQNLWEGIEVMAALEAME